jgi:glycosyltransferase involved in cell wall biosynthesis
MKISIITVVFNGQHTIARAIESVLSQKNIEIEYIVVDGASQDDTLSKIAPYRDKIGKFISEQDAGIYDAMNKGINLATGDVVGMLNADDYYVDDLVLSKVMEGFEDPNIDAVYGDLEYFRGPNPSKVVRVYRSNHFEPNQLKKGLIPAHPTLFLRKSIYQKYGLFKTNYKIAGDFEFIARIFKESSLRAKYLPLRMVRMQMGGVSTGGIKNTLLLLQENMRACRQNNISTSYLWLLSRYPKKLLEYLRR